jgi:hypothetical protein
MGVIGANVWACPRVIKLGSAIHVVNWLILGNGARNRVNATHRKYKEITQIPLILHITRVLLPRTVGASVLGRQAGRGTAQGS